ncbi:GNAT family N-acetyltransferase [Neobacillus ginsengisoli]|uniref:RimJ/RimL family protein N-acetyltransferase n=1 Tax=Neobacillus ginsengisoli TaxID=904295 RepID=A0ABT9XQK2_9BACI|nr:GNAT family N-acetyltransferase [Neobacillus ginsengisoli]MDQ0197823.1 RimJ/RimL family protein N-acetyltransferase [Neobacillus ginsengisoli]
MPMYFEGITNETLYIALEIINSNHEYNTFENGKAIRNINDIDGEFINPLSTSSFIKLDDTYIGLIDYLMENPNDHYPWLGLLMIHRDYQGYGFGAEAYALFENEMLERGIKHVRIGVLKENTKAHSFWKSLGFVYYKSSVWKYGNEILCYEKQLG